MGKDTHDQIDAPRILLVEDSASLANLYQGYLEGDDYEVTVRASGMKALDDLPRILPDLVLLDLRLPDVSGMEVLRTIHERGLDFPVIIITAHGSVDTASEAMRLGAADFLVKPFDATRLRVTVQNILDKRRLSNLVSRYEQTFERNRFHGLIGRSLAMQAIYRIVESAAPSKATVFITGESGTGKELCAQAIHQESSRREKQFVAINCAAIPRDLMESEIFGHVKGAFTGATSQRDGAATRADGGTLFLDEICEMDLDLQSKLLRFIQTGTFQRVGGTRQEEIDLRIVCATNRDPLAEVKSGRFREDLYYRLNVIQLQLPPLRSRGPDILLIASELLKMISDQERKRFKGFSPAVAKRFDEYDWRGNVRELENTLRQIVILNDAELINWEMLPASIRNEQQAYPESSKQVGTVAKTVEQMPRVNAGDLEIRPLWQEEMGIIDRAIDLCEGNIPKAAAMLEISASTIYRKLTAWEKNGRRENRS